MEKGKKEKVKSLMLLFLFDLVPKLYLGMSGVKYSISQGEPIRKEKAVPSSSLGPRGGGVIGK